MSRTSTKPKNGAAQAAAPPPAVPASSPDHTLIRHTERVSIDRLKAHPRNYRRHPEDQLEHLVESLRQHGWYRSVVTARDLTILAGHGIVEAARKAGCKEAPVVKLDLDPEDPRALKVLAADNELVRFAESDDRMLTELLKEIAQQDATGLLGTGYDEAMLAALVMVTRPASEIADFNAAAEWGGMPEYDAGGPAIQLVITFDSEADRAAYVKEHGLKILKNAGRTWSTRWPDSEREAVKDLRFEG